MHSAVVKNAPAARRHVGALAVIKLLIYAVMFAMLSSYFALRNH